MSKQAKNVTDSPQTTPTTVTSQQQGESQKLTTAQQEPGHEFQIAADLTLYANPLRCLHHKKADPSGQHVKSSTEEAAEEAGDIIAADLTMYGSPLDDN